MINFLEEKYGCTVCCSTVTQDGYEARNLIVKKLNCSSQFSHQGNGLLVEHYIKPPVEVNFSFPIPIQVSSVKLGLRVGAQVTNGVEVLVTDQDDVNGIFRCVFRLCPISEDHIEVTNGSYQARSPFTSASKVSTRAQCFFKCSRLLNRVKIVKIRLIKTLGSSVPGLGSIEVWGQTARSCSTDEHRRVLDLYAKKVTVPVEDDDIQILPPRDAHQECLQPQLTTPDDFLDPLTQELMANPVVLPSGQTVDRSTLEKVTSGQASWGRPPCDPFTGIAFGQGRRPLPNVALKARIDSFLIRNSHLDPALANTPRTTGHSVICEDSPVEGTSQNQHLTRSDVSALNSEVPSSEPIPDDDHERAVASSLQLALNSAFNKSILGPLRNRKAAKCILCAKCKTKCSQSQYKLPCAHFMCRTCVLSVPNVCPQCNKNFLKEEVQKNLQEHF